ncbi:MAG: UvrB/UvrC motif-containing protein [Candidatus Korobacteraceae bacterium]
MAAQRIEFFPDRDTELFSTAAASAAVFVLRGDQGSEPYVGKSSNLRRRLQRLLGTTEGQSRKLNLRDRVRWVEWTPTGSDFEAGFRLYQTLRREFPQSYGKRLRLRFAPLVKFILDNPYPRATITTRISGTKSHAQYFGPFPTRVAAEKFANDSLDLFKMRRCVDDLHPDPAFPGCIYSEMKMCLAPCFKGCSDEQYAAEVDRVQQYFASGGQSLVREIERQRDEASTNLDFEGAALLHVRLEKVKAAASQLPEIVRRLDQLNGLMVQPSAERESVTLFKIVAGRICDPVTLSVGKQAEASHLTTRPQSMEARITEALATVQPAKLRGALEWMEHLALLKRWYYRSTKAGELFLAESSGELPMRRVVRGVSRVFRGEKPSGDLSETAGDYWKFRAREAGITEN